MIVVNNVLFKGKNLFYTLILALTIIIALLMYSLISREQVIAGFKVLYDTKYEANKIINGTSWLRAIILKT